MRGILVPDVEEDFTADPVELFFDLAFVFAFSRLVAHLIHHPSWSGAAEATLLFLIIWFVWSMFTWSANAVSGNGRLVRLVFVIATAITVPMAASVETAYGSGGINFATSTALIMVLSLGLNAASHERGSEFFESAIKFGWPTLLVALLLVIGGLFSGDVRVTIWIIAVGIGIASTVAAGSGTWIVRPGHFAERHGLILIIALGEVIVAMGISVAESLEDGGLDGPTRVGLVAAGIFAGLMWWGYFDRVLPALEHRGESLGTPQPRGVYTRDVYTFAHAPIIGGVIAAAAAIEEILLHPSDPVPVEFRVMLAGGLVLFALGVSAAVYRAFKVIARERIVATALIVLLTLIAGSWQGIWLLILVDIVLIAALIFEHVRIER